MSEGHYMDFEKKGNGYILCIMQVYLYWNLRVYLLVRLHRNILCAILFPMPYAINETVCIELYYQYV